MKKFYDINSLRAIAIIQVILIHVFSYYFHFATTNIYIIPFFDQLVQSAVPIFIFISGFTLSLKYWDRFSIKTFYKKRFKNLLFPYAFFCFIYVVIPPIIERKAIDFSYEDFLNILFDPWKFFYLFWFIALIFSFYLFYPLLVKIFLKFKNHLFIVLLVSILIQIVWRNYYVSIIKSFASLREFLFLYKFLIWIVKYLFLRHIAYFVLGVYISKNYSKITLKKKYLLFSIVPILIFATINVVINDYAFEPFLSIFIILFFLSLIENKRNIILDYIAKFSFGIYLIHGLVILYVVRSLNLSYNYWYFYLFTFILTFSISFILIYGLSKIPKHHYLIGKTSY